MEQQQQQDKDNKMKPTYSNRYLETSNSTASLKTVKPDWSKLESLEKTQAAAGKPPRVKPSFSSEQLRRDGIHKHVLDISVTQLLVGCILFDIRLVLTSRIDS